VICEEIRLGDVDSWIEARPAPSPGLHLKSRIDYSKHPAIGRQTLTLTLAPQKFRSELATSRTFLLETEAEWLRAQGLARRATARDLLVFDDEGPIDNELRFEDECVRHKLLDLVGDLALGGCDLHGQITAHCSGHRLNAELVRALLVEGEKIQPWRRCA
jgi:UDP-3-O-acyl-N-acetylglucosamine deacetylase